MRAIVCHEHGPPEVMQYEEIPCPVPQANELLIRAEAIGVNYVDTMRRSGRHPAAPVPPFTPGIELCGEIVRVGAAVKRFQPGDRVIGRCVTHGAYAEFVCVAEQFAVPCPAELTSEQGAAFFVTGQTAYHALVTVGRLNRGESVLITAAGGGVGTCAVQVAKLLGGRVLATASTPEKRELLDELGADTAIDPTADGWSRIVLDATGGRGADLIIESVGGTVAEHCLRCWAPGGRMVVFGKASGQPARFSGDDLLFGNRTVTGLAVGTVIEDEARMRTAMDQLFEWLRQDQLHLKIGRCYPLREAAQAHRHLESRQSIGKLILKPE